MEEAARKAKTLSLLGIDHLWYSVEGSPIMGPKYGLDRSVKCLITGFRNRREE
jgi:hypothetical protein